MIKIILLSTVLVMQTPIFMGPAANTCYVESRADRTWPDGSLNTVNVVLICSGVMADSGDVLPRGDGMTRIAITTGGQNPLASQLQQLVPNHGNIAQVVIRLEPPPRSK